jgi:EmrB/QacA subfamily drug resistance transporter
LTDVWAVNVAAPSLQHDLRVSDAALQLIVVGYAFMYATGMVTGGRLGDLFGYRRLFLAGVAAFVAASLLCGVSQSPAELVVARLVQGLTGAVMVPQVLALITAAFPPRERSRAVAWYGATMGFGFVSGQILGGGLIQSNVAGLGWRAIFLVNVPVGIIAAVVASFVMPPARGQRRPRLDPLGALGISVSLALALVPLTLGRDEGWPAWTWASLAAALPGLALTIAWERRLTARGGEPLLDLGLFSDRAFSIGLLLNFAVIFFFGSFMFVLTLLLQSGLGNSPLHAGIDNLPMAVMFMGFCLLGPSLNGRLGARSITVGTSLSSVGVVIFALIGTHYGGRLTGWDTALATTFIGVGQGMTVPSLMSGVLAHIHPNRAGAAAGVLTTTQQFAIASGVALIGAVFYGALGSSARSAAALGAAPTRSGFVSSAVTIFWIDLALLAVAAALTFLLPGRAEGSREAAVHWPGRRRPGRVA